MIITVNLNLLKSLRELNFLSISDIAAYLDYKTPTSYWLVESGQRNMSISNLYKLSLLFKIPMEQLLVIKEEDPNNVTKEKNDYDNCSSCTCFTDSKLRK